MCDVTQGVVKCNVGGCVLCVWNCGQDVWEVWYGDSRYCCAHCLLKRVCAIVTRDWGDQWQKVHARVRVAYKWYECFGVLEQQARGVSKVHMVACEEGLTYAEEHSRGIWDYQGTVLLDETVKFVICALDKCCKCAFVCSSTGGPCE